MKTTVLDKVAILLFLVLLTLATLSFGKKPSNTIISETEKVCKLLSFSAKKIAPRTYLNWQVQSAIDNYCFVLEKSTDGLHYSIAEIKRGYVSPNNMPLHYSFVDEKESEQAFYRIKLYKIAGNTKDNNILILSEANLLDDESKSTIKVEEPAQIKFNNL